MILDQAILFDAGIGQQIIGCSEGINEKLLRNIESKIPSADSMLDRRTASLRTFKFDKHRLAFCRTTFGSWDNSDCFDRGTLSRLITIDRDQLSGYNDNPALFAFRLQVEGLLFFPDAPQNVGEVLRQPEVADVGFDNAGPGIGRQAHSDALRISRAAEIHGSVAVTGIERSLQFLIGLFRTWKAHGQSTSRSFSIGTKPSADPQFDLWIFNEPDHDIKRRLLAAQIRTISDISAESECCSQC